jgi:hypothetical protein
MLKQALGNHLPNRTTRVSVVETESREGVRQGGVEEPFIIPKGGVFAIPNPDSCECLVEGKLMLNQTIQERVLAEGGVPREPSLPRKRSGFMKLVHKFQEQTMVLVL